MESGGLAWLHEVPLQASPHFLAKNISVLSPLPTEGLAHPVAIIPDEIPFRFERNPVVRARDIPTQIHERFQAFDLKIRLFR